MSRSLWNLSRFELDGIADFDEVSLTLTGFERKLTLRRDHVVHADMFRLSDPVAEQVIASAKARELQSASLTFDLSGHTRKLGILEPLAGKSGYLRLDKVSITSFESEDHLVYTVIDDDRNRLHPDCAIKMFDLAVTEIGPFEIEHAAHEALDGAHRAGADAVVAASDSRNRKYFEDEIEKLERWAG